MVKPGSTSNEPVISVDFFPTFLEIAGLKDHAKKPIDGVSLVPVLNQSGALNRRAVYWHCPHYHSSSIGPCGAVRAGDYKLIEWFDESICGPGNEFELYNLREDISERSNLAKKMPERVENLKKMLYNWRSEVNAQMLTPNPAYNPQKAEKSGGAKMNDGRMNGHLFGR